jgi:hypothetical protein
MVDVAEAVSLVSKTALENISLSRRTNVRRVEEMDSVLPR